MSELATQINIKRPTLYVLVKDLQQRGYVTAIPQGKRKLYDATPPTVFEQHIAMQTQGLKEVLPSLLATRQKTQMLPEITVIMHEDELRKLYASIYDSIRNKELVWFLTSIGDVERHMPWVLEEFLASLTSTENPHVRELLRWDNPGKAYTRKLRIAGHTHPCGLLQKGIAIRNDLVLWKDHIAVISVTKRPWALIITDSSIFSTVQALYEFAWATRKER